MMIMEGDRRRIRIKLESSSSSSIVVSVSVVVVSEEERVDLGSIARSFGIVPSTLRLNGYFIAPGLDQGIASSVTWRSLLSFFSARHLPTQPIVVHGNLIRNSATKRSREPEAIESGSHTITEHDDDVIGVRRQLEDINFVTNKRLCKDDSEVKDGALQVTGRSSPGFKRKQLLDDHNHLKKLKMDETNLDFRRRGNDLFGSNPRTQFACRYMSSGLKRPGEDVIVVTTPCKKIR